ncbi:MAG UNVERIFIED_CONTAM: hypothetical protein LVT10_07680 [Anaerolineae bacterium]
MNLFKRQRSLSSPKMPASILWQVEKVITNPTQLRNLAHNDLFDDTELIQMIEQQEFGAIIFRAQFYPPKVLQAIHEAYEPNESESVMMNGFKYIVMRPRTK